MITQIGHSRSRQWKRRCRRIYKTKKKKERLKKENPESKSGRLIDIPYVKRLCQTTVRIMKKYERTYAFKPGNTLCQALFRLKDKSNSIMMADVICKVQCKACPGSYIEESTRLLEVRLKEHMLRLADKVTKTRAFTCQQRKSSLAKDFTPVIAEHTATEPHS